mmetsp:Transcript_28541/g.60231  ORF Transcript_28541/g.60231 Transcript_28541/m.60231 type:complete len:87 (-) Transcript_28541:43-303(-)
MAFLRRLSSCHRSHIIRKVVAVERAARTNLQWDCDREELCKEDYGCLQNGVNQKREKCLAKDFFGGEKAGRNVQICDLCRMVYKIM